MGDDQGHEPARCHLLVVPYPAQPHILPMLDLARQIARRGDVDVTFVSFKMLIDRLVVKEGSNLGPVDGGVTINFIGVRDDDPGHEFPSELPQDPIVLRESLLLGFNMEPYVEQVLRERQSSGLQGPTCMLVDMIHWWSIDIAARLSIPRYALAVIAAPYVAALLSWYQHGLVELPGGGIRLAGLPADVVTQYRHFNLLRVEVENGPQIRKRWPMSVMRSDGLLLNTWTALDSPIIDCIRPMLPENMPLLAVGPLGVFPSTNAKNVSMEGLALEDDHEVTNWLDHQLPSSVLYVSFGTTGLFNLSKRHVLELAIGLEKSQQPFVWVLRASRDVKDVSETLPEGFEERTKGRALLLKGWAPQKLILAHSSTGGFLSSCGWNSTVESLSRGVPIIGYPSFADQPTVCRSMAVVSRVAVELPQDDRFFVKAEDIVEAIEVVMRTPAGAEMRDRARKCKADIADTLAPGGSSVRAVEQFYQLVKKGPAKSK